MKNLHNFLISTLILTVLSFNPARAAAPPGRAVTPSITLQGGSNSTVKWAAPATVPYKVHVFVPSTGNVTNALYRVYPKGKRAGSTACLSTDKLYPCFAITIDQTQHKNAWVQLTLNGDPETQWTFTKTRGYVAAVADNLGQETLLNLSGQIRFSNPLAIGIRYGGGIIFYLDSSGQHGLIAAANDQSTSINWDNGIHIETGATATAVGSGQTNTDKIIAAQGEGYYAAKLADDFALNGYSDWFLPSKDELNLMYGNIGAGASPPLTNIGDFDQKAYYWSSTESSINTAEVQHFGNGIQAHNGKNYPTAMRCVRAF